MASEYSAKDIVVLEGLEPVRKRPGMYIGGTDVHGLHHLVWEALDNAVDEAINGHCSKIDIVIEADGAVRVTDDGRGIPVDTHPKFKKPALEIIMCTLHAGGKFDNKSYSSSGGLHGVGISVVNALSEQMDVTVWRQGNTWTQTFSRGVPAGKLKKGEATKRHGTSILFMPDDKIFSKRKFNFRTIADRAETKAFLNSGLSISVEDKTTGEKQSFRFSNGLKDYMTKLLAGKNAVSDVVSVEGKTAGQMQCAFAWTIETESDVRSFCNSIFTADGGTHETGLRNALTKSIRSFMERRAGKGKAPQIVAEDVREGLVAVVSVLIPNPQFQGQTKGRLNNPEVQTWVESAVKTQFEQYLIGNPTAAEAIAARVSLAAEARLASRAAKDQVLRKTFISHRLTLPGKLADCSSTDPEESELFIVEGDSAGGSSKQARDRRTQAILPLRGKIRNVESLSADKMLSNSEIEALVTSIGTGVAQSFDLSRLRYDKIIIMTDADVDGSHISVLLLTFFYRHMKELLLKGHVYLAQPPLYRLTIGKEVKYALNDQQKEKITADYTNRKIDISRFKGLGEMPPNILKETTMNPASRTLLRVKIENDADTSDAFERLMGKDPAMRLEFIQSRAEGFEPDI